MGKVAGIGVAVALLGVAGPAAAEYCQVRNNQMFCYSDTGQVTRSCTVQGGQTYCPGGPTNSGIFGGGNPSLNSAQAGAQSAMEAAAAARAAGREPGFLGLMQDMQQASLRKKVGKLIADGHCDEAFQTATTAGDLALAKEVQGLCGPSAAQSAPPPAVTTPSTGETDPAPPRSLDGKDVKLWVYRNTDVQAWTYFAFNTGAAYLYAIEGPTATPQGTFTLWVKEEEFQPLIGYPYSGRILFEGDCRAKKIRIIKMESYPQHNLEGRHRVDRDDANAQWQTPKENGSTPATQFKTFCRTFAQSSPKG